MTTVTGQAASQAELSILAALEEHGNRMTFPCRELAAVLGRWTGSFTAEEIVARMPDLGRATIYRTIQLLVDVGVLCQTALLDGSPRYSLDDVQHHHHLVCVSCGRVDEFRHPYVERMLRVMVTQVRGVVEHRLELYHRCEECVKSGQGSAHAHGYGAHPHTGQNAA